MVYLRNRCQFRRRNIYVRQSYHNKFQQVDKLRTIELVRPNMRTERQCNAWFSHLLTSLTTRGKKSAVQALYRKTSIWIMLNNANMYLYSQRKMIDFPCLSFVYIITINIIKHKIAFFLMWMVLFYLGWLF